MHEPAVCRQTLSYLAQHKLCLSIFHRMIHVPSSPQSITARPTLHLSLWASASLTISHHSCGRLERHWRSSKHYDSRLLRAFPFQLWGTVPYFCDQQTHKRWFTWFLQGCHYSYSHFNIHFNRSKPGAPANWDNSTLLDLKTFFLPLFTSNYLCTVNSNVGPGQAANWHMPPPWLQLLFSPASDELRRRSSILALHVILTVPVLTVVLSFALSWCLNSCKYSLLGKGNTTL